MKTLQNVKYIHFFNIFKYTLFVSMLCTLYYFYFINIQAHQITQMRLICGVKP